jgi:nitrogen regulatory protein PII
MQLYPKKKVEIVVEAARIAKLLEMIKALGGTGHTVIPELAGKGRRGIRDEAHVSDVLRNALIIVIATQDMALRTVEEAHKLLKNYADIIYVSDVSVVRDDHF